MQTCTIRKPDKADIPKLLNIFTQSIHQIDSNSYSEIQLNAWAPPELDITAWANKLDGLTTYLADVDSKLAGFISLLAPSHIEMLFTAPPYARSGVATALYQHLLNAECTNIRPLTTNASFEARPFFEKFGWQVVELETVNRHSVPLERYQMILN